jgi:hypothetical protein
MGCDRSPNETCDGSTPRKPNERGTAAPVLCGTRWPPRWHHHRLDGAERSWSTLCFSYDVLSPWHATWRRLGALFVTTVLGTSDPALSRPCARTGRALGRRLPKAKTGKSMSQCSSGGALYRELSCRLRGRKKAIAQTGTLALAHWHCSVRHSCTQAHSRHSCTQAGLRLCWAHMHTGWAGLCQAHMHRQALR